MEKFNLYKFWKTLCILIYLMVFVNYCQSEQIQYEENNGEITCVISDLYLGNTYPSDASDDVYTTTHVYDDIWYKNKTSKIIFPEDFHNKENVVNLVILSTRIEVFTSDFCNAFPNLRNITANRLSIKRIDKNAFENCLELKKLSMSGNKIEYLDNNLFRKNSKLQFLKFDNNPIKYVTADVFKNMGLLYELSLQQTCLLDIDLETIIRYTSVEHVELQGTKISCRRWDELNSTAEENNVWLNYYSYEDYRCIDEESWSELIMQMDQSSTLLEDKIKVMFKRIKEGSTFGGSELDNESVLIYFYSVMFIMVFVILILSIITIVSLICCCKAHYARYKIKYQTIPEYNN